MIGWFRRRRADVVSVDWSRLERSSASGFTRLVTRGLPADGVRNLELTAIPDALAPLAADLLLRLATLASSEKPQTDGASIGGPLVDAAQPAIHIATLRIVSRSIEPAAEELFRVVDYNEAATAGFPSRLMATHLAALAEKATELDTRERLYRQSISLFPGAAAATDGELEFSRGENLNNYVAWEGLGETLFARGDRSGGSEALEQAATRCPAWAADFAAHIVRSAEERPRLAADPAIAFWLDYAKRHPAGGRAPGLQ